MVDGTSNTVLFSERYTRPDGEHVLTAVQHASQTSSAVGEDSRGLWQINLEPDQHGPNAFEHDQNDGGAPSEGNIRTGGWISDVTYEDSQGGNAVAMETLTIAHEGLSLL